MRWCAVIDRFAVGIDATDIGHVDGGGVVALDTIADMLDGEELVDTTIGVDDIMITRIGPAFSVELSLEVIDGLTL